MFDKLQNPLALAGRLLMAWLFVHAGIDKLTGFSGAVAYISSADMPMPHAGAAVALVVEIVAGIALIVGYHTRIAALVLAVFTLAATLLFHNYLALPADQQIVPRLLFNKNIAVVGGLLTLAAWGAGAWSLDGRNKVSRPSRASA